MTRIGELRALTGARGIAAWWVVLYHLRQSLPPVPDGAMAVIAKGYLAVDFFFVLSGFVIALAWGDRVRGGGWRVVPAFLKRRFARVWPLHATVLTGGAALALLLWATGRHDPVEYPVGELPLHYLLIQNWGLTSTLSWNVPAWSISAESFAYLLFPLLVANIRFDRWASGALVGAGVGIAAAVAGVLAMRGVDDFARYIPQLGLIRCVSEFTIGMLTFELYRRGTPRVLGYGAPAALLIAIAAAALGAPETLVAPPAFAATVLLLAILSGRARNPLCRPLLHRLGEWSYATYLSHFLMWKAFKLAFVHAAGPVAWPLIALYLAMVLAASALLYRLVELPAQAWINRTPQRAGTRRRAPA